MSDPSVLVLGGCRPEPIGSYLKALGVLRLVSDQADPNGRGAWGEGGFVLHSALSRGELVSFFLERYRPTPVLDPWNKDFWEGRPDADPPVPDRAVRAIAARATTEGRFKLYADSVGVVTEVRAELTRRAQRSRRVETGRAQRDDKRALLLALRARLPDEAVEWLDAVAVVTSDGVSHPRLLGSGGNDGRFEVSVRFAEALGLALLPPGTRSPAGHDPSDAVGAALFGDVSAPLEKFKVGFLDPGHAGGTNSGPLGDAGGLANPWDFLLALEGAVCFAAGAARRMSWRRSLAAEPFAVVGTSADHETSAEQEEAPELWAPLWAAPASAAEVRRLIGEGRAVVGRRPARSGLDLAEAAALLGVDRGIEAFVRHAVVPRFGRQRLIVPVGRVAVVERPAVSLLEDVDTWVQPLREKREDLSGVVRSALGRLDRAEMAFATSGRPGDLQGVLVALASLEAAAARSPQLVSATQGRWRLARPVQGLLASRWVRNLDDYSTEFRLAVSLASARWPASTASRPAHPVGALALLVRPVEQVQGRLVFREQGGAPLVLPGRPLTAVLADALVARVQEQLTPVNPRREAEEEALSGVVLVCPNGVPARLADVTAFLAGALDDRRLGQLLRGLALLEWDGGREPVPEAGDDELDLVPPAFAVLAPFAHGVRPDERRPRLRAFPSWAARLRSGAVAPVLAEALQRLRWASLEPVVANPSVAAASVESGRLAAALLFRLVPRDAQRLLWRVALARETFGDNRPSKGSERYQRDSEG
jgi:CRISPR-associated protein Csx17